MPERRALCQGHAGETCLPTPHEYLGPAQPSLGGALACYLVVQHRERDAKDREGVFGAELVVGDVHVELLGEAVQGQVVAGLVEAAAAGEDEVVAGWGRGSRVAVKLPWGMGSRC